MSGRAGGFDLRNPPHAVVVAVILVISLLFGFLFDLACGGIERLRYPRKYRDYVETYASRFSVPEAVLYAVMRTESGFDSAAESSAGAVGLMQLMPDTFRWLTQDVLHEYLEDASKARMEALDASRRLAALQKEVDSLKERIGEV